MLHTVLLGIAAWIITETLCVLIMRQQILNIFDPLILDTVFISFSGALVVVLSDTKLIPEYIVPLFFLTLIGFLIGGKIACIQFDRSLFRDALDTTTQRFSIREITAVFFVTLALTLVLAALGIALGASGDARQAFAKIFRPLVLLQTGSFFLTLILLLSKNVSGPRAFLCACVLTILTIPFSGKSVFLPFIFWIGLRLFVQRKALTLRTAATTSLIGVVGVAAMGILAYRDSTLSGIFRLLAFRLWMSGDSYIYAYQFRALSALRGYYHVSFVRYILHPFTALVGFRAYKEPLGAMLASRVVGHLVMTGPNPQLPVLLDFFFRKSYLVIFCIAALLGFLVIGLRSLSISLVQSRARFISLSMLSAAIFVPGAGFIDIEQSTITLISILSVAALGCLLDLLLHRARHFPEHYLSKV